MLILNSLAALGQTCAHSHVKWAPQGWAAWKALESSGKGNVRKACVPGQEGHPLVSILCGGQRGGQGCHGVRPNKQEHGLEPFILRMSVVAPRHRFAFLQGTEDAAGTGPACKEMCPEVPQGWTRPAQ